MSEGVSLVIPGRNCAGTLRECLGAVGDILRAEDSTLREIIFVDDGSTDDSAAIAREFGVRVLAGPSAGPGPARNVGWKKAIHPLVWFIDSDCVARPDALKKLLRHMEVPGVGAVGGSYDNMLPESLLASMIHEEIAQRHQAMPLRVNFLGGFNVLYRREALERVGGFDPQFFTGEDAELGWRVQHAGYELRIDPASRVGHFHSTRLWRYLRSQRQHGIWRVFLYLKYHERARGDDYSSIVDHVQPPLAMLSLVLLPLLYWPIWRWIPVACLGILALAQLPLTLRLIKRTKQLKYLLFAPLGFARSFARGIGMVQGIIAYSRKGRETKVAPDTRTQVET